MKKIAFLLAMMLALTACGAPAGPTEEELASSAAASSEAFAKAVAEATEKAVAEALAKAEEEAKAASEAAASEAAASEAEAESRAAEAAAFAAASSSAAAAQEAEAAAASAQASVAEQKDGYTTSDDFNSHTESSVIKLINKERARLGLTELKYDASLATAARIRSRELYEAKKFAHTRPNGDDWSTVLKEDVPLVYVSAGENLATTEYNDPRQTYASSGSFWYERWETSPPHYANIIREDFTHIGVGVYIVKKNGMVYAYATSEFAHLPE